MNSVDQKTHGLCAPPHNSWWMQFYWYLQTVAYTRGDTRGTDEIF